VFFRFVNFVFRCFWFLGTSFIYTSRPEPPSDSVQKEREYAAKLQEERSTPATPDITVDQELDEASVDELTSFRS
jgi:hypothetical protein